jgi:enamine deaminase RidA (YjgF/YER057c/UK114 family)
MSSIAGRLERLGIILPEPPKPVASYVGYVREGNLVFISGQLPFVGGKLGKTGIVGRDVTVAEATAEARVCAINLLAQARAACGGDLDRISRCVRLGAFIACGSDFAEHPKIVNGASDLMFEVLGEAGQHARTSVGVASLPMQACVEVEAIFAVA